MKIRTLIVFVFLIQNTIVNADVFNVAGKSIEIPTPEGYVRVTKEMDALYRVIQQAEEPLNEKLALYISKKYQNMALNGGVPEFERYHVIKVNKLLKDREVSNKKFIEYKSLIKKQNEKFKKIANMLHNKAADKTSENINKEFNANVAMEFQNFSPLKPHYETDAVLAYSMYQNFALNVEGEKQQGVISGTVSIINISGKLIYLGTYGSKKDLSWTRVASKGWVNQAASINKDKMGGGDYSGKEAPVDEKQFVEVFKDFDDSDIQNKIGLFYLKENKYNKAIRHFNESKRIKPDNEHAYYNLGLVYLKIRKYNLAIDNFNKTILLNSKYKIAYLSRGLVFIRNKKYERGIQDYDKAIEIDPDYFQAYTNRGIAFRKLKKYENAISDFDKSLQLKPDNIKAYNQLGIIHIEFKKYNKAIADFSNAINIKPQYTNALINRARAYIKLKNYKLAFKDLDAAIKYDKRNSHLYNALAWLYATLDDKNYQDGKKAIEHAKRACELTKWKKWKFLDTLAAAYARTGDFKQAIYWQGKVIGNENISAKIKKELQERMELYQTGKPYTAEE